MDAVKPLIPSVDMNEDQDEFEDLILDATESDIDDSEIQFGSCYVKPDKAEILERILKLHNKIKTHDNHKSLKRVRVCKVLSQVYGFVRRDCYETLRGLFYSNLDLFNSQHESNNILTEVCNELRIRRIDLNVSTYSKGRIFGAIEFCGNNSGITSCYISPVPITQTLCDSVIRAKADFILVVESEAMLTRLVKGRFSKLHPNSILITGCGFSDIATRTLVATIVSQLKIPICSLVDGDIHGYLQYLTIKYGSLSKRGVLEEERLSVCPSANLIGLFPSQASKLSLTHKSQEMSERELKMGLVVAERCNELGESELAKEIELIISSKKCYSLGILSEAHLIDLIEDSLSLSSSSTTEVLDPFLSEFPLELPSFGFEDVDQAISSGYQVPTEGYVTRRSTKSSFEFFLEEVRPRIKQDSSLKLSPRKVRQIASDEWKGIANKDRKKWRDLAKLQNGQETLRRREAKERLKESRLRDGRNDLGIILHKDVIRMTPPHKQPRLSDTKAENKEEHSTSSSFGFHNEQGEVGNSCDEMTTDNERGHDTVSMCSSTSIASSDSIDCDDFDFDFIT